MLLAVVVCSYWICESWNCEVPLVTSEDGMARRAFKEMIVQRPARSSCWLVWGWGAWKTCSKTCFYSRSRLSTRFISLLV